ncbi:MAG: ABC transporter permease subunit, partial [Eubacteriales bacterium]
MNILRREIKTNTKALIIWCFGMVAMIGGGMSKYLGLTMSGGSINDMLELFPQSVLNAYGISGFDLSTALGFYGVLFLYILLIGTIHATMLGANIIAKEERDKTAEFLYIKPVSRSKVITSKLLASLSNILILNIVTGLTSFFIVNYFNKNEEIRRNIFLLMVGLFALQLLFLVIGLFVASLSKKPKGATSLAAGVL